MNKSDLRSGMLVTLRNNDSYYVMLNTGLCGRQNNVLVHKVGEETGWMSLDNYDQDMAYHDDEDTVFPNTPKEDIMWDIVSVSAPRYAPDLCIRKRYKSIWTREE